MANKKTIETTNDKKDKISIIEIIQDIDARLTHLEDISADNRELIVKLVKQGNTIVQFLKDFEIEGVTTKKHSPKSQSFFSKIKEVWEDLT